ncbi:MAG: hypothetical protein GY869_07795, partial [Planctomycetes bacterium]|nr:hypothetical protein [Planctomycetota bacterium]
APVSTAPPSHSKPVYGLAISGDGRYAYSGSSDHTCFKWDMETGQMVERRKGENGDFGPFALTSDSRYMILTDYYGRVFDLEKKDIIAISDKHKYFINAVAVTRDDRRVVTGSENGTLLLWDLFSGQTIHRLKDSHNHVLAVSITRDGHFAITAEYLNGIKVYNLVDGKHAFDFGKSSDEICTLALSPDDRFVISGGKAGELMIWDLEGRLNGASQLRDRVVLPKGRGLTGGGACPDGIKTVAVSPQGDYFVSGHKNQLLRVFHLHSGMELIRF